MQIWRVCKAKYATPNTAFDGMGGLKTSGRWNHMGVRMAYAAEHPRAAAEEYVRNSSLQIAQALDLHVVKAEMPDSCCMYVSEDDLPSDWSQTPHPDCTKDIASQWVFENGSLALMVPTVVAGATVSNILVNPLHKDFDKITVVNISKYNWHYYPSITQP